MGQLTPTFCFYHAKRPNGTFVYKVPGGCRHLFDSVIRWEIGLTYKGEFCMTQDDFATAPAWDEGWVERLKGLESKAWDDLVRCYGDELRSDIQSSIRKRGL